MDGKTRLITKQIIYLKNQTWEFIEDNEQPRIDAVWKFKTEISPDGKTESTIDCKRMPKCKRKYLCAHGLDNSKVFNNLSNNC